MGVYRKSLYYLFNFAMNLKLVYKINSIQCYFKRKPGEVSFVLTPRNSCVWPRLKCKWVVNDDSRLFKLNQMEVTISDALLDVVSFLEQVNTVFIWPTCSFQSHQEGWSPAIHIHMGRITVHIHVLAIGLYVNLSFLHYMIVQKNSDHLNMPQSITLVHSLRSY